MPYREGGIKVAYYLRRVPSPIDVLNMSCRNQEIWQRLPTNSRHHGEAPRSIMVAPYPSSSLLAQFALIETSSGPLVDFQVWSAESCLIYYDFFPSFQISYFFWKNDVFCFLIYKVFLDIIATYRSAVATMPIYTTSINGTVTTMRLRTTYLYLRPSSSTIHSLLYFHRNTLIAPLLRLSGDAEIVVLPLDRDFPIPSEQVCA